uniref:U4/U6.U5 small nuclear ribonucleoprotein 27 kDa protein n=1 Tax=Dracunculus medinensis TaxID=318479 RepID=A0A0N4UJJ9_DRAME
LKCEIANFSDNLFISKQKLCRFLLLTLTSKSDDGFSKFSVLTNKPRRYHQYMNRNGGFNRPFDYVA